MSYNPFDHTNAARLEAVNLLTDAFAEKAFTDSVLPGRTNVNPDELPASLIYLSDPLIIRKPDEDENETQYLLQIISCVKGDHYHPEELLDKRGKVIWDTFNNKKIEHVKNKILGVSFEYETDTESNLCSLTITFKITLQ